MGQEGHLLYSRRYRRVEWVRQDTFYSRGIDLYSGSGRIPAVQHGATDLWRKGGDLVQTVSLSRGEQMLHSCSVGTTGAGSRGFPDMCCGKPRLVPRLAVHAT